MITVLLCFVGVTWILLGPCYDLAQQGYCKSYVFLRALGMASVIAGLLVGLATYSIYKVSTSPHFF